MALPIRDYDLTFSKLDLAKIETLMQASPRLRQDISSALRKVKDPRALPLFQKLLADPDESVRYAAMYGVYEICGGSKANFASPGLCDLPKRSGEIPSRPARLGGAQQRQENVMRGFFRKLIRGAASGVARRA